MLRNTTFFLTVPLTPVTALVTALVTGCSEAPTDDRGIGGQDDGVGDWNMEAGGSGDTGNTGGDSVGEDGPTGEDNGEDESGGSGEDGSTDTGTDTCGEVDFKFTPVTPLVMLVLDKSGSMMTEWDYNGELVSRWLTLHDVVSTTVNALNETALFGLKLFPKYDATEFITGGACDVDPDVEVTVAENNADAVIAAMPAAGAEVLGGTPATEAFNNAVNHLNTWQTEDPKVIILVTDGAANCVGTSTNAYDDNFNTAVGTAYMNNEIPTYVVGIDIIDELDDGQGGSGVNLWEQLNDVADRGGVPKEDPNTPDERFYNAADGDSLQQAIDDISNQIESCVIDFEGEIPPDPKLVTVTVNGNVLDQVTDCETESGWVWVNPDGPYDSVELCGGACETLKETGVADVTFGCPPPV